ncbi:MAG: Rrf2 family transcriptional regulator [Rhodoferax sp.]|uniref:Rrf2 family transcriptional regulator n=1 Tax=Rhodoferax sp. TaxID=50421 RepID=UPI0017E05925|nr:Rrf2 family transcriptional regulator [Rhodoferax sp.]NMM20463.1 Rrf2 family transcriptional regulator [Rhodoferax sp.]
MRLSTKGRFAVTAMIDVALRESLGPVPLSDIAVRHKISLSYLEQMFSKLRQHGLVESTRGPGGGYTLGQRSDSITVADIIGAVDGRAEPLGLGADRAGEAMAPGMPQDITQDLWDSLNSKMVDYMQSISLRTLTTEQRSKGFRVDDRKIANRGVFKKPKQEPVRASTPNSVFALGKSLLARG